LVNNIDDAFRPDKPDDLKPLTLIGLKDPQKSNHARAESEAWLKQWMKSTRGPEKNSGVERIKCFVGCLVELIWYADLEPDSSFTDSMPVESEAGRVESLTYTDSNPNPETPLGALLNPPACKKSVFGYHIFGSTSCLSD